MSFKDVYERKCYALQKTQVVLSPDTPVLKVSLEKQK